LGWEHPAKLHFISIDFTKESLIKALTSSLVYDPKVKSFFNWLGVTYFLTRDEVFATLHAITEVAPAGSMVVFDYFDTDAFIPNKWSPEIEKYGEFLKKIGEPIITGFNPSTLGEDIKTLGFRLYENLSSVDIEELYFQGCTDYTEGYEHIACAIVE
jgi:O-methyltransferase involved in polyketide biosynthesis